jgi:glycosyltransferase involved in cell wall biosynthesis
LRISIIIPVYNVSKYLSECLDSVFKQDLADCEVITINDGSTDDSRDILSQYKLKHPDLIIIDQQNKGLSGARNAGMKIAKGEYLYFLDSDDYLLPNAVKMIMNSIQNSSFEVFGFNATANGDKILIPSFNVGNSSKTGIKFFEDFYIDNGFYPSVNVWVYVYRKSFLERNHLSFFEGLYHEDILFSMQIFYITKEISAYNIPIVNYRQYREGSICTDVKLKNIVDKAFTCRMLDEYFEINSFFNIYFYNSLYDIYLTLIRESQSNGYLNDFHRFFGIKDKKIMRKGVSSRYDFKLWFLSLIHIKLMLSYNQNCISSFSRRLINLLFSIYFKVFKPEIPKS